MAYTTAIRNHLRRQQGRGRPAWFANRDKRGTKPSLDRLLEAAEARAEAARIAEDNARRARELAERKVKQDAERRAAGLPPARGPQTCRSPRCQDRRLHPSVA